MAPELNGEWQERWEVRFTHGNIRSVVAKSRRYAKILAQAEQIKERLPIHVADIKMVQTV